MSELSIAGKPESIRRLQLGAAQLRYASRMVMNDKDFRAARRVLLLLILNYRHIEPWPRRVD